MSRVVRFHEHGGAEVLRFEEVEELPPEAGEVTIAIKAIGLNRSELMFRNGRHMELATFPARLGYEAAGYITAVGAEVSSFAIGEPVSLVPPPSVTRWGTYAHTLTLPAEYVVKVVGSQTLVEAAATWMAAVTAYGMLVQIGKVQAGEDLLVLAASSSVGLACIQMAHRIGARAIVTTRTREKASSLISTAADEVIVTSDEDLLERVRAATNGRGVQLALDPIAGPGISDVVSACSMGGKIVLYGELDPNPLTLPVLETIRKGLTVRGYTFKETVLDTTARRRAIEFIQSALADRVLRPVIDRIFPFEQIADAHRYIESSSNFGKVVVTV